MAPLSLVPAEQPRKTKAGKTGPEVLTRFFLQLTPATRSRLRMQDMKRRWCIGLIVVGLLAGVSCFVVLAVHRAGEAEKNLHAVLCAANSLESFVQDYGRWPSSWSELGSPSQPMAGSMYQLPRDLSIVRSRVNVCFDLESIEATTLDDRRIVVPVGPCFEYQRRLDGLYQTIAMLLNQQEPKSDVQTR